MAFVTHYDAWLVSGLIKPSVHHVPRGAAAGAGEGEGEGPELGIMVVVLEGLAWALFLLVFKGSDFPEG